MGNQSRVSGTLTLEEFLATPDASWREGKRYLEYIDGRIEAKVSPQGKHSLLTVRIADRVNLFAEPARLGLALVELRCTFAGRSIIPDVAFFSEDHIEYDADGEIANAFHRPPDLHVAIISPEQSVRNATYKLIHSTAHGCQLGLLVHPQRKTIDVFGPGMPPERLLSGGVIFGEPILPGFRLPVTEVFGWLRPRRPSISPSSDPGAQPS
ncbi:MAG: Uma2 family endonuclease [Isosphaeraceae bacterium]|nr:Uma2 family endonuclease [Isosphaeraceae bacterium]